jgi:hypothetical protein
MEGMTTYRPQFVFPAPPPGYEDEQFHYSFDGTNCPLLSSVNPIAAGGFANNIVLLMQSDATFIARCLKIELVTSKSLLYFQLKTPRGDYMQSVPVPLGLYAGHGDGGAISGRSFVSIEGEIEAPPGSNWTLYLYNPTTGSVNPPAVTLYGVKRRKCSSARGRAA